MNQRIKELAEQYACHTETMTGVDTEYIFDLEDLQDFADLVRQDEREACAKLCDGWSKRNDDVGAFIGRAIRAKGDKHE